MYFYLLINIKRLYHYYYYYYLCTCHWLAPGVDPCVPTGGICRGIQGDGLDSLPLGRGVDGVVLSMK